MSSTKSIQIPKVIPNDWNRLRIIIDKLKSLRISGVSSPEFNGLTLSDLAVLRLIATNSNNELISSDIVDWISGTANQITVTDNGDGTITLSTPQDLDVGTDLQVGSLTTTGIIDAHAGEVLVEDNDTIEPSNESDGYVGVAYIDDEGRIYFAVNGQVYYVSGTAVAAPSIETGNPIGLLLTLTYTIP